MLMMSIVLRHQFPRRQATLLMIEHRRRRRRRARRHNPYFRKLQRPNRSWVEIHHSDQNNSRGVFQKETANESLYLRYSVECFATSCNTRKHQIAWLLCSRKSTRTWFVSSGARELLWGHWAEFQCWKIDCSRSSTGCCGGSCAATSTALLLVWWSGDQKITPLL